MIIRRYVVREVAQTFAAVLGVLALIYVSNRLVRLLAEAAAGELAGHVILELVALKLVTKLALLVPLALYVAVLLVLGRLHRDREIVAMTAGGFGLGRMAGSVLWLGLGFGVIAAALSLYVNPGLAELSEEIAFKARRSTEISGVYPGRFMDYGKGDRVFYVESISEDRRSMTNVFVRIERPEGVDVLFAERARHRVDERGDRYMELENGNRYEGTPGISGYSVTEFHRYSVRIDEQAETSSYRDPETMPTLDLLGSPNLYHVAELQWRYSLPLSTVLLAMLAMPLARAAPGEGRGGKLFAGVLVYFIYSNLLNVATTSIERGNLAPAVGVWPVHAVLALAVTLMILHQERYQWRPGLRATVRDWRRRRRGRA